MALNINIKSGVPTADARDFAKILANMYAFSHFGYPNSINEISEDEFVVTCEDFDYESQYGVHRLVRISPFDEQKRRHTCFAVVEINGKTRNDVVCSYVLEPYQMVKNHITNDQTDDTERVFSGYLLGVPV